MREKQSSDETAYPRMLTSYVLLIAAAGILVLGFAAPPFRVSHVEVLGSNLPVATVASASDTQGQNIFTLKSAAVLSSLRRLPNILVTGVALLLPNTVAIHARLRRPVLGWQQRRRLFLVDKYGRLTVRVPATTFPIIHDTTHDSPELGGYVDARIVLAATEALRILPGAGINRFTLGIKRGLMIHSTSGWQAVLGRPTGLALATRIATLGQILLSTRHSSRRVKYVVLTSQRAPYVSFF